VPKLCKTFLPLTCGIRGLGSLSFLPFLLSFIFFSSPEKPDQRLYDEKFRIEGKLSTVTPKKFRSFTMNYNEQATMTNRKDGSRGCQIGTIGRMAFVVQCTTELH
ncbi:hypothetical protein L9F63_021697, partial [Diploptera punctata]